MTSLPQFCLPNFDTKVGNADLCHDFFSSTEVATLPLGCIVLSHEGNAYVYFLKCVWGQRDGLADNGACFIKSDNPSLIFDL